MFKIGIFVKSVQSVRGPVQQDYRTEHIDLYNIHVMPVYMRQYITLLYVQYNLT